jgi:hypothetical protein
VASFSFVSLTGATNSVEHGEVTTQSTLDKMKNQVKTFLNIEITSFACLDSNVGQNQNIQLFLYTNSTSPLGKNRINT